MLFNVPIACLGSWGPGVLRQRLLLLGGCHSGAPPTSSWWTEGDVDPRFSVLFLKKVHTSRRPASLSA